MKVAVTGATGMIGSALVRALTERGDVVTPLSRSARRAAEAFGLDAVEWQDPLSSPPPAVALRGHDAVVNLLGEPVAQRWSEEAKREIRDSRVLGTRNLVAGLAALDERERPRTLVSQSGVDFYEPRGDDRLDEMAPGGHAFLAGVTAAWEAEALEGGALGVRVVTTRTGVVLSDKGGALQRMLPPFKLGFGGPVAGGRQYVPWVHLDDVVGAIRFCLDTPAASGPVNVVAPEPVTNRELSRELGRVLRRPAIAPVPALALKLLYGEMATIVITGRRVVPKRLLELGYSFRRPDLADALRDATGR
ncbi:MAG TPA: TIGR01777 family oxidoreductase [Thermoleophilaceae bacterium]|nr:TIGR01777 family oxidoreductase [Thermoleophilaceae bacterium]